MSKTRPARKARRSRRSTSTGDRTVDVMSQLACATRHPSAALLGGVLGGAVPWFARELAHAEIPQAWRLGQTWIALAMLAVVLGCCVFSMLTVYKFGRAAFGDHRKAVGFVAALEGVMLVSHGATSLVALLFLVGINAIANGCVIALAREATVRRESADARRSATRAQNRARARGVAQESPLASPVARPAAQPVRIPVVHPTTALVTRGRWVADGGDAEAFS